MTDDELDAAMKLLDDHDLDGPGIDDEDLRQSTLAIPELYGPSVSKGGTAASSPAHVPSSDRSDAETPRPSHQKDVVLICSGGGHLEQMVMLQARLPFEGRRRWITVDSVQSRSLLEGEDVEFVPEVFGTNKFELSKRLARSLPKTRYVGSPRSTEAVISTGSSIALAYLPYSALRGIETYYIESATCIWEPSLTGKTLERVPGVSLLTQHPYDYHPKWQYCGGSVLDEYEPVMPPKNQELHSPPTPIHGPAPTSKKKVLVSLGLNRECGFRPLLQKLQTELAGPEFDVTWQIGESNIDGLNIKGTITDDMRHDELQQKIRESDLVIAHAGTGIALAAINVGKRPLLVPRDHHQLDFRNGFQHTIAGVFQQANLAETARVEDISTELLMEQAGSTVEVLRHPGPELKFDAA